MLNSKKKMALRTKAVLCFLFVMMSMAFVFIGVQYQNQKRKVYHSLIEQEIFVLKEWQAIHLDFKQDFRYAETIFYGNAFSQKLTEQFYADFKQDLLTVLKKLQGTNQLRQAALDIQLLLKTVTRLEQEQIQNPELKVYLKQIEIDLFELFAQIEKELVTDINSLHVELDAFEDQAFWQILIFMIVSLVLGTLISINIVRHIKESILQLINFTQHVSSGYIEQKIHMDANDEVGELVHAFNNMTENLSVASDILQERDHLKDEFMSVASHEIRTPIAILQRVIENLKNGVTGSLNPQQEGMLKIAEDNIMRLSHLIRNLLDLARLESDKMKMNCETFSVKDLIANLVEGFRALCTKEGVKVESHVSSGVEQIYADKDLVAQVITNLFNNAVRYAKSTILIQAVAQQNELGAPCLKISVMDDGPGISKENQNLLFQKFKQVDRKQDSQGYKGTGLGLAICKQIVMQHDGKIGINSELGEGTEFYFILPQNKNSNPS